MVAHVLVQVGEFAAADVACLPAGVRPLVPPQDLSEAKPLLADLADIWSLTAGGVHTEMQSEVIVLPVAFAADVAVVWPFTCVRQLMNTQVTGHREPLATDDTSERLLTCMYPHMLPEADD